MEAPGTIDVRLLGPVEAIADGTTISLGGELPRGLLAVLTIERNRVVSSARLIDELWGDDPPARARESLQMHVSRLRRAFAEAGAGQRIVTRGGGYLIELEDRECDVERWQQSLGLAQGARSSGEPDAARALLDDALAIWRGEPIAGATANGLLSAERARLEQQRLAALSGRIDLDLELGRQADVIGEIEALIVAHPYSEALVSRLMLAQYRAGRQADALATFAAARRRLVDELGLEPGPELRRLQQDILLQAPHLAAPHGDLPPELEPDSEVLAGRDADLAWLEERWSQARRGRGRLVLLTGTLGVGRTRLAAELAARVHAMGATVAYTRGPAAADTLAGAAHVRRPTLIVLDDADAGDARIAERLEAIGAGLGAAPVLVVAITGEQSGPALEALRERLSRTGDARRLEPLGQDAVELLARAYARRSGEAPPTEELLAASAGLPEQVHRAAWAWARAAAGRGAQAAAGRAADRRRALRAVEDELAGDVIDLQRIRRQLGSRRTDDDTCPFQGLAPFGADDARFFFGRERLIAKVIARLAGAPVIALVGASGSGKSSVLQAGLLPALASGVLPESDRMRQVVLRPGDHPLGALERAGLADPEERVLLAVDQFEEVWAACPDEDEREAFLDALVAVAERPAIRALLAIRADFYGRCATHAGLAALLDGRDVLVDRMRPDELRDAIELPAREVGLSVDAGLVDTLVTDVAAEPGGLPLLSSALVELWRRRGDGVLRLEAYEEAGGVQGAVARLAEEAYGSMTAPQRTAARRIFLRLATDEPGAIVRRRVPLEDFDVARDEDVALALAVLIDRRLLIASNDTVEVAHEALLHQWPRLAGWLEEDADGRRLHAHVARAAREWEESGREPGELYRGARLAAALTWSETRRGDLNARECEFLDAGRALADREATRARRANRRLRVLLAGVAVLLVLAVIGGAFALSQRSHARDQASLADAERLGAQALVEPKLDRSMLLAVAGQRIRDTRETRGNLLAAQLRSPAAIGELHGDGNRPLVMDLSPGGRTLAVGDNFGTVRFYDTASRRQIGPPYTGTESAFAMGYSPDGRTIAVGGFGYLELVDAASRRGFRSLLGPRGSLAISGITFASDGRVMTAVGTPAATGVAPAAAEVIRWRAADGARLGHPVRVPDARSRNLASLPDGRLVLGGDAGVELRDATGARRLRSYPVAAHVMALSPDGRTLVAGSVDGTLRALDLASGKVRSFAGRHAQAVQSVGFTPNAKTVISTGDDAAVMTWDARTRQPRETFQGHAGRVLTQAVSDNGTTLYTASLDGDVIIWDLAGQRRLGRPFVVGPGNPTQPFFDVSPDGSQLAVPQQDGTVRLLDAATLTERSRLRVPGGPAYFAAFSPDGKWLAITGTHGLAELVDRRSGRVAATMHGHTGGVWWATFSPDGRTLATTSDDGTLRFWRAPSGAPARTPWKIGVSLGNAAFSPDGRAVAFASQDRPIDVRDVRTGRTLARLGSFGQSATFTRDGRTLITGAVDGKLRLWSTRTWRLLGRPIAAHAGYVLSSQFGPDGRLLATGGTDGTVRLWDLASRRPLGTPLPGQANWWVAPRFSPDGRRLFAIYENGRAYAWPTTVAAWRRHACTVAARDLTASERQDFLPDRDGTRVCPH
jgi:WD40 repeat protein/DNA-binding SARP family transcriptional activator